MMSERKKRFIITRKFSPVRSYIIKQVPPWKEGLRKLGKAVREFSPFFIFIFLVFSIFAIAAFFIQFSPALFSVSSHPTIEKQGVLNYVVKNKDVLSVGTPSQHFRTLAFSLALNCSDDVESVSANISILHRPGPTHIFVLKYPGFQDSIYPVFVDELKKRMKKHNLGVSEITYNKIPYLPPGSVLIVPTGYIPSIFLDNSSAYFLPNLIFKKYLYIIYIGQSFVSMIPPTKGTVSVPTELRVIQTEQKTVSSDLFHLERGNYVISGIKIKSMEGSFSRANAVSVGVVSGIDSKGCFLAFPTILDNPSWAQHPEYAAEDVETLISAFFSSDEQTNSFLLSPNSTTFLFSPFVKENEVFIRVDLTAKMKDGRNESTFFFLSDYKTTPCDLFVDGGFAHLPYALTKMDELFYLSFTNCKKLGDSYFLVIKDTAGRVVEDGCYIAREDELPDEFPFRRNLRFAGNDLGTGYYILSVVDEVGRTYASMLIWIKNVSVVAEKVNVTTAKQLIFHVVDEQGNPVTLPHIVVSMDNSEIGEYTSTSEIIIDLSKTGMSMGEHEFKFSSGTWRSSVTIFKRGEKNIFTDPFTIGIMLFTILIVVLSTIFARNQKKIYRLDIPDFPPFTEIKVPIKPSQLEAIFEKMERMYRWSMLPLSLSEIRKGFSNFTYKQRPVFVSEYNLKQLLEKAEAKGIVASAYGYFALKKWEDMSGRNIEELVLYRKLRDLCIKKAIPFSELTKGLYDVVLNLKGRKLYIHLMSSKNFGQKIMNALKNTKNGMNVLLFNDASAKEELVSLLFSPSVALAMLKLALFSGDVSILTIRELSEILDELRGLA